MSFTVTRAYMRGRLLFIMSGFFLAVTAGAGFISWQASQARNNAAFGAVLDAMSQTTGDVIHHALTLDQIRLKGEIVRERAKVALRGGETFVPVDWDTAIRLVAGEVDRVRQAHGNTAIFGGSYGWSSAGRFHHARTQLHRCLNAAGGFTGQLTNYSYAAGMTLMPHIVGSNDCITGPATDWPSIIANARVLLCFGGLPLKNGEVCSGGAGEGQYRRWLREAGAAGLRIVNVSPLAQDAPAFLRAEWLPIRPGTDTALMLAMAHVIVSEGREDKDFLATHCVGWPALRAYILGESDGQAKTPAWAAPITGIAAETIVELARAIATEPTMITSAWSIQRQDYGEQPYWMTVALAAITGGIGKRLDATVIDIRSAIENHLLDACLLCPLGNQLADLDRGRRVGAGLERTLEILLQGRGSGQRVAIGVVDDLGIDVLRRTIDRQARTVASDLLDLLAHARGAANC